MKQPKYCHTITGQVKTRRQWIKVLNVIARDLPGDATGTDRPPGKSTPRNIRPS